MLSESQIESLATSLADLLVAEWNARHPVHQVGSNPQGALTMRDNTDAESTAYGSESQDHDPGPTPTPKAHGSDTVTANCDAVVQKPVIQFKPRGIR